jgi:hypothetical protein
MVGYLIAEWREWEDRRLKVSVLLFAAAGLLGLMYRHLQPFFAGQAASAASVLAGWLSANRFKPGCGQRRMLAASELGPGALVAARCLASIPVFAFCILVFSPALVILGRAWDFGALQVVSALCLWFGAFFLSMSISFLSGLALGPTEHPIVVYAILAWILPSSFIRALRIFNPFVQSWAVLGRGDASAGFACAGAELALAATLLAGASLRIKALRRADRG